MSLALYRRYRPETFAEVIGQEHVTDPLQQALRNNRVNHAYLFSGPRGCGKTTSARILARCLNCEQGPTPTPCNQCQSCLDLARNGPGSIDVIEIDAASHGGVDDARDLREKAFFGPAGSRYKIYIIDEAHMVTSAGFNALLKVVEEPPEHLKFIFATTEPEKVIGTIRSRTHHYPFRLVPPGTLRDHLAAVCEREAIPVEPGVYPLVVRSGAGSVRDSMSVMDQLLAGAGEGGVTYAMATALLGYTDAALLDDVVDGFAAGDGAAVFEIVDRVVEGGHDPRRFVADLLERLRDLVILAAVPDALDKGLIDAPQDVVERMLAQASVFGAAELSRAADLVSSGLTEMRGATSPRLQLELICARVLLPAAYDDARSLQARLERLERGVSLGGGFGAPAGPGAPAGGPGPGPGPGGDYAPGGGPSGPAAARAALGRTAPGPATSTSPATGTGTGTGQAAATGPAAPPTVVPPPPTPDAPPNPVVRQSAVPDPDAPAPQPPAPGAPAATRPGAWPVAQGAGPSHTAPTPAPQVQDAGTNAPPRPGAWPTTAGTGSLPTAPPPSNPVPAAASATPPPAQAQAQAQTQAPTPAPVVGDSTRVRQLWPQILEALKHRRLTWMLLLNNAHVAGFDGETLQIGFDNLGARNSFANGDSEDVLKRAISEVAHAKWRIETLVDPGGNGSGGGGGGGPRPPRPQNPGPGPGQGQGQHQGGMPPAQTGSQPPAGPAPYGSAPTGPPDPGGQAPHSGPPAPRRDTPGRDSPGPAARVPAPTAGPQRSQMSRHAAGDATADEPPPIEYDIPEEDDPGMVNAVVSGHDLFISELGATVIEEIRHE